MKIWIVKHKGKTWWGNLVALTGEMTIGENTFYYGNWFFRKKDVAYMKAKKYQDYHEVVSCEVSKSKQDNRK